MVEWVPDHTAHRCMMLSQCLCITSDSSALTKTKGILFSYTQRKHHCRHCGKIFCAKCSGGKINHLRACHVCVQQARDPSSRLSRSLSQLELQRQQLDQWIATGSVGEDIPSFSLSARHTAPATPTLMLPLRPLFTTMSVGTLDIEIVKARNLTGSDFSLFHEKTSDPYCTLEINGIRPLIRTKVKHENNNPIWNQCFRISLNQLYDHVRLRVYDKDIDVLNVVNDLTGGLTNTIMQVGGVGRRSRRKKDEDDGQYVPSNSDDFLGGISIPVLAFLPKAVAATATGKANENGFVEGWFPLTHNEQFLLNGTAPSIDTAAENDDKTHNDKKRTTTNHHNSDHSNHSNHNNHTPPVATATTTSSPEPTQPYCGEIYLRARVTTTTAAKCVSSVVPVVTPINYIPPTEFNIDLLWQWLTLNLNYGVYPVMEGMSVWQELRQWTSIPRSTVCLAACVGLSLRPEYLVVCLHVWVLQWLWRTRSALKRREDAEAPSKKDLLVEALLQQSGHNRGESTSVPPARDGVDKEVPRGNGESGVDNEEEEGFGLVVHSLLALMPFYVKENLIWSQDLLRSSARGLIYVYDVLHWKKNETTTWAIFVGVALSLGVFSAGWGDMNRICLWGGVLFVLSGTIPFQIVATAVVGIVTTLMTVASPPSADTYRTLWKEAKNKMHKLNDTLNDKLNSGKPSGKNKRKKKKTV